MNPTDLIELDPVRFVRSALGALPAPEAASAEDLRIATATGEGLAARTIVVTEAWGEVGAKVLEGTPIEQFDECALLQLLSRRAVQARDELKAYTYAAIRARGIDPDRLAGHLPKE